MILNIHRGKQDFANKTGKLPSVKNLNHQEEDLNHQEEYLNQEKEKENLNQEKENLNQEEKIHL